MRNNNVNPQPVMIPEKNMWSYNSGYFGSSGINNTEDAATKDTSANIPAMIANVFIQIVLMNYHSR